MENTQKQFGYKLLTNIIRVPISLAMQSIFPRLLGPVAYGSFDFLIDNANKFINFIEAGSSTAFYVKLSQNALDQQLVRYYWNLAAKMFLLYLAMVLVIMYSGLGNQMWPGQGTAAVLFGAFYGMLLFSTKITQNILDANHLTVRSERLNIFQLLLSCIVFSGLYFSFSKISLEWFFIVQLLLLIVLLLAGSFFLKANGMNLVPKVNISSETKKIFNKYFIAYSMPLFIYNLASFLSGVGDRWILQIFGGSIQQAYFSLSFKIAGVVLLMTTAMTPLLMRDFSVFHGKGDLQLLKQKYISNTKLLYVIVTFLAVNIYCNASLVVNIIGGKEFQEAGAVLSLMAFYPIHQTIGQLNGTLFYATNRVKTYTIVGMINMCFGIIVSYFLVASPEQYGLGLGAFGLATGWLIVQFINTNIGLFFNCRFLEYPFIKILGHQVLNVGLLILIGLSISFFLKQWVTNPFLFGIFFFIFYAIFFYIYIFLMPAVIGLKSRYQILNFLKRK